jgi:acyl-CoA reductase-like NAD-dependent aldehyde dehydrogenase
VAIPLTSRGTGMSDYTHETSSTLKIRERFTDPTGEESRAQDLFNKQKAHFDSDATKSYEWVVDQLDRLTRMLKENFERFADASRRDFKTASQENVFEVEASIASSEFTMSQLKEWMKPLSLSGAWILARQLSSFFHMSNDISCPVMCERTS